MGKSKPGLRFYYMLMAALFSCLVCELVLGATILLERNADSCRSHPAKCEPEDEPAINWAIETQFFASETADYFQMQTATQTPTITITPPVK